MRILNKQGGFTLIELITVILILALLAVFAIPRYFAALTEARISTILGVEGALQSAVALTKARAKLSRHETGTAGSVTLEMGMGGTAVVTHTKELVPTGDTLGIEKAIDLRDTQGKIVVSVDDDGDNQWVLYTAANATDADTCRVKYNEVIDTGIVSIDTLTGGC